MRNKANVIQSSSDYEGNVEIDEERKRKREGGRGRERGGRRESDIDWIFRSPLRVYVLLTVIIAATAAAMGKIETSIIPVTARKCKQWAVQRLIPLYGRDFARRSNVNGVVEVRCEARRGEARRGEARRGISWSRSERILNRCWIDPLCETSQPPTGKKKTGGETLCRYRPFNDGLNMQLFMFASLCTLHS